MNPKVLDNSDPGLVIWVLTITLRKRQISPNGLWLPGPLVQSVEQRTFNPWVVGSIPTGPTPVNEHSPIEFMHYDEFFAKRRPFVKNVEIRGVQAAAIFLKVRSTKELGGNY